jgi:hypothetical protein
MTGVGACLDGLRRTRSGQFGLAEAVTPDVLSDRERALGTVVPLDLAFPPYA